MPSLCCRFHFQNVEAALHLWSGLFLDDGSLNPDTVPPAYKLLHKVYEPDGHSTVTEIVNYEAFVKYAGEMYHGGVRVPRAGGKLREQTREQLEAFCRGMGTRGSGYHLAPGARPYAVAVVLKDAEWPVSFDNADARLLVNRSGWHDGRMAKKVMLTFPPRRQPGRQQARQQNSLCARARKCMHVHMHVYLNILMTEHLPLASTS